jgi:hypothetical protein
MNPETLKTRGFHVGLRFAPPVALDKPHRQEFQIRLSQGFDWRRQEFADKAWVLATPQDEGDPRSLIKLTLQPDSLNFEEFFPVSTLDLFIDNLRLALDGIAGVFNPRVILGSGAMLRIVLAAPGGDARVFLGHHCLQLEDKLAVFDRPVHGLGLRLVFPPVTRDGKPTWQANLKIESLVEDVRQIFVEVDAKWLAPVAWNADAVVERTRTVHEFATDQMLRFLGQFDARPPTAE